MRGRGKAAAELEQAAALAAAWVAAVPDVKAKYRVNAVRIGEVCRELVGASPAQEPTAPRVAEAGSVRYPGFPSARSIYNRYGSLLRIWRDAYQRVVDVTAPVPHRQDDPLSLSNRELAELDAGTRARVQLLAQVLRESKAENDRLKALIRREIPAPRHDGQPDVPALPDRHRAALLLWLHSLEAGRSLLDLDALGARASRRSRPGMIVIPSDVLDAMRVACGHGPSPPLPEKEG